MAALSGILATALDLVVLTVAVRHGVAVAPAAWLGAAAGAVLAFFVSRRLAFSDRSPLGWQQVAKFSAVSLVAACALAGLMHLTVEGLGVPTVAAKLGCSVMVFTCWTLPAQRQLVFAPALPSRHWAQVTAVLATARRARLDG